jgi:hypothetical protein
LKGLADRLRAAALAQTEGDQLVGQQLQSPVAMTFGRLTARNTDQLLLNFALDLDLVRARRLGPRIEGGEETFGDQALADAADRSRTDP